MNRSLLFVFVPNAHYPVLGRSSGCFLGYPNWLGDSRFFYRSTTIRAQLPQLGITMKTKYVFLSYFASSLLLIHFISPLQHYALPIAIVILLIILLRHRKYLPHLPLFYLLSNYILLIQRFTKKDTYILFDNLYEANAECIDTYSIFQYMQAHHIPSYYVIWKENPLYRQIKGQPHIIAVNTSVHNHKSFEFFNKTAAILPRTKAVITSFGDICNLLVTQFLYSNPFIQYIHVGHGSTFLKTFILTINYLSPSKYNKFLVANSIEQNIFMEYGWQKENLPIIGLPRWDNLKRVPHDQKTIFVMFTWRTSFSRSNRKKFTTSLTNTQYYKGIMQLLTNPKLQQLLQKHHIKLRYTLHHSMLNQCVEPDKAYFPNLEYVPCEHISQYIGTSDLFITDYSSLFFDFAFLNIPVIFYRPDYQDDTLLPNDREDIQHAMSMDPLLFNACYDIDTALATLEKYIKNDFVLEPENIKKLDKLFANRHDITPKFINYLENL